MAFKSNKPPAPIEIDRYLGINEAVGETEIALGEAISQLNWRITQNFKPQKRQGHKTFIDYENTKDVQGMWSGTIATKNVLISCNDGKVYEYDFDEETNTEIGTLTDARTSIFYFEGKLYFLNGTDYKEYDGTTFQDVDPYIPTVAIYTEPSGGLLAELGDDQLFEPINLLTGKKKQEFYADGSSTRFFIAEQNVGSIDSVKVEDATYLPNVNFKAEAIEGIVDTFPVGTPLGDSTTQYTITNPTSTTFRYTWTTVGTDPLINDVLAVNDCVQILAENFNEANLGIFKVTAKGVNYFEVTNASGVKEKNKTLGKGLIRTTLGDATSQFDITNPSGTTMRYTYDATGTSPQLGAKLAVDDWVWINAQNFNDNNNGKFKVTAKDTNYFEIVNVNGIAETNKTLGIGFINKATTTGEPIGVIDDEVIAIVQWTKTESGNADLVKKNRFAMINGPGNDTSVFLWGNPDAKNRRSWSDTLKANYFPVINFTLVGSDEFAITDIKPQYNRQIIFKQDRTHYSYPEWNSTADAWDYPVFDLNEKVGNEAFNAVQIVRNNPVSLAKQSWWEWTSTAVEDERNANAISERLRVSLSTLDFTEAITFDYQREKEYWMNIGEKVYIWNYGNDTMYIYDNISGTIFLDIDGSVYYGSQGTIERMEGTSDNGVAITAQLKLGFSSWGAIELKKNTREVFPAILPESQTSLTIYYRTDRTNDFVGATKKIEYRLLDFNNIDFNMFSFLTNRNPQPFRVKIRAKKYAYIQFMFENKELSETCTILAFKVSAETQGLIR